MWLKSSLRAVTYGTMWMGSNVQAESPWVASAFIASTRTDRLQSLVDDASLDPQFRGARFGALRLRGIRAACLQVRDRDHRSCAVCLSTRRQGPTRPSADAKAGAGRCSQDFDRGVLALPAAHAKPAADDGMRQCPRCDLLGVCALSLHHLARQGRTPRQSQPCSSRRTTASMTRMPSALSLSAGI